MFGIKLEYKCVDYLHKGVEFKSKFKTKIENFETIV